MRRKYRFSKAAIYQKVEASTKLHQIRVKDASLHPLPCVRRVVLTQGFEVTTLLLIIMNCVFIGWQAEQWEPEGLEETLILVFEQFFTLAFLVELGLRLLCYNWTFLLQTENYLDIFLVVLSVINSWILFPAGMEVDFLRQLTVLRTLRLIRLARAVRLRPAFKEMWQLLSGLMDSAETLFWTYVMFCCVLYFFAVMATTMIGKNGKFKNNELAQEYFGDVLLSMLTLFQVMTLDSWTGIMRPLMEVQPWIVWFFIAFISVAVFLLLNLVTAVIVENAFERSKHDEADLAKAMEAQKEAEIEELRNLFWDMDLDGSGFITRDELDDAVSTKRLIRQKLRSIDIHMKDLDALWEALDDGDGLLDVEEFVGGMRRLKGEAKAKDILRLFREVRRLETSFDEIQLYSDDSKRRMMDIKYQLRGTFRNIDACRRTLRRVKEAVKLASRTQRLC